MEAEWLGALCGLGFAVSLGLCLWEGADTMIWAVVPQAVAAFASITALAELLPVPVSASVLIIPAMMVTFMLIISFSTKIPLGTISNRVYGDLITKHPWPVVCVVVALCVHAWAEERRQRSTTIEPLVAVTLALILARAMPSRLR